MAEEKRGMWKDRPLTVAAGSIIVVVGQLFGTIFPIWFGPDLSDYSVISDPIYHTLFFNINGNNKTYGSSLFYMGRLNCNFPSLR